MNQVWNRSDKIIRHNLVHEQLFNILNDQISRGEFPVNSKLPGERELARVYDVSHNTVNKVIKQLEAVGLVTLKRGLGAFVANCQRSYDINQVQSFRDWCIRNNHRAKTVNLAFRNALDDDLVGFDFYPPVEEPRGHNFVLLKRTRYIGDLPVIYELRLVAKLLLRGVDAEILGRSLGGSWTEFLGSILGTAIHKTERKLTVVRPSAAIVEVLKMKPGDRVIKISGRSMTADAKLIDHDNLFYHCGYFEFVYTATR